MSSYVIECPKCHQHFVLRDAKFAKASLASHDRAAHGTAKIKANETWRKMKIQPKSGAA